MNRFYVENNQIKDERIYITGPDVNHIRNVLRMKVGEKIIISNGQGNDFYCIIESECNDEVVAFIKESKETDTELKGKLYLFQGIPKKDKMELIIQKAVELGVYEIIPVMTKRTVVKLEDRKKELKKLERWQAIATSAAKQSGRGIIPVIKDTMSFKEAVLYSSNLNLNVIPYENAENMSKTKEIISAIEATNSIGVFIGPEGGFEEDEVNFASSNSITPITLGRRILRTETAGLAILSMMMLHMEE